MDLERVSIVATPASARMAGLTRSNSNEINVVMVAACIPTLRPLYLVVFNKPGGATYMKRPYHHTTSEQNADSHSRTRVDHGAADDWARDTAQQELVAVPYKHQEVVVEDSQESGKADTHESWFDVESAKSIAPKRSGSIRQTIELDVRYHTRARNSHEETGLGRSHPDGLNML